ncbi:gag/pol protein [Cucumis melo var. makuwa]|uniref:Gag/pol protein n=1 Tax=Cucumis melo var. makuwa TaxID=1194695 RepID=A0A5D3BKE6_CUCMM|nr:gag/pol protein [Cucumis melo var. makuwa]
MRVGSRSLSARTCSQYDGSFQRGIMNEAAIDEASQVSFILESLPKSFLQFRSNTVMNKFAYTLITLLNKLQTFESLMKIKEQKREANVIPQESSIEVQPLGTKFIPSSPDTMKWKKKKSGQRNKANPAAANTSKKAKLQRQYVFVATRRNIGRETVPSTWQKERRPNKGISS